MTDKITMELRTAQRIYDWIGKSHEPIETDLYNALRAALAQKAVPQEPVAWDHPDFDICIKQKTKPVNPPEGWKPLYAAPPAPAAVPLTDDEMMVAFRATHGLLQLIEAYVAGVAFAERHHGIAAGDKPVPARLRAGAD